MKKKTQNIVKYILPIILIVVVGGICSFLFLKKTNHNPEDTLNQYMSYIMNRNYEGMYELISEEAKKTVEKDTYLARNKNIYEGIEISDLKTNVIKTNKKGTQAEIIYQVTMQTIAGEITFSNTSYLSQDEEGKYKINWSSSDIFPDLKKEDKIRVQTIEADRGKILDRNGIILAGKQTASEVGLVPNKINAETKEQDIAKIAELLDISVDTIQKGLSASYVKEDTFVPLRTIRKTEQTLKNQLLEIKGIKIIDTEERIYPLGEASSHLIGYIQGINQEELNEKREQGYNEQSVLGKSGLEKIYEDRLRAMNGAEIYIVDTEGKKVKTLAKKEAKNGEDMKLTIDSTIQKELYEQFQEDKSVSVAINPKTGEILALVSTPTFDSNDFSLGMTTNQWNTLSQDENKPLYNRFLASYAPGSSFKPLTGAIGLTIGAFTEEEDFGPSGIKWQKEPSWDDFYITTLSTYQGKANLKNALIYSDNIYFAKAALKIGKENFAQSLKTIGFNQEIQTPVGKVTSSYSNTDGFATETALANSGYGQAEVLVNPIHMAMIYSAFINNGNMVNVSIIHEENTPTTYVKENAFSTEAANIIKEDLVQVVEDPNGTAHSAKKEGIRLAGKTGTAEIKSSKEDKEGTELGWFNCFIADENSDRQLLIISMVEDVKNKGGSHYVVDKIKTIFN